MNHLFRNIMIGSDPELFLIDKTSNKIISSIGIIPGVKGEAWRDKSMPEGYGLQIDNILAEFNIPPVAYMIGDKARQTFISEMNYMKNFIKDYIQKINPNLDIYCAASAIVEPDQLQSDEAKLFGCSPDYNVYTQDKNPKPDVPKDGLRSAGMHIHIGYDNPSVDASCAIVRGFDCTLGLMSVILDRDNRRRSLYGKAGAFRLCDYGVEYRVLSSYFLSNDKLLSLVWQGIVEGLYLAVDERFCSPSLICDVINTGDATKAMNILESAPVSREFLVNITNYSN